MIFAEDRVKKLYYHPKDKEVQDWYWNARALKFVPNGLGANANGSFGSIVTPQYFSEKINEQRKREVKVE